MAAWFNAACNDVTVRHAFRPLWKSHFVITYLILSYADLWRLVC